MNILIDLVPDTVDVEGIRYKINTDFRVGILFELLFQDRNYTDEERIRIALNLYYEEIPRDEIEAIEKILWFYRCGKEIEAVEGKGEGKTPSMIYSFEHDAEYIYAAFLSQYGIDLQDIEHLHWWKFKAMFRSLKDDNKISEIIRYRAIKITNDMSKEEKKFYREMKKIYGLPDNRTEEEKEKDFADTIASIL
ncbi:bacteriophage Gp15 family protein [Schnuerera sp.]|uniref:bacteriophage Gp15 family protein n=1 Tax=Schnuerera sp. TaxID=2794844 RepID=UPI002CCD3F36|nr:bacteriophage Gp15 family protein [Schnuerera sp.]HSH35519.1 bacteriophage Gp15 family protein [Schnuerera sp.]